MAERPVYTLTGGSSCESASHVGKQHVIWMAIWVEPVRFRPGASSFGKFPDVARRVPGKIEPFELAS